MVFESVVTDVLNRFLGNYVENLDATQLKIGIWGGDVVLNNLELKQSALSELDLPVQTVYGRLEKLVLKIPWKNLYGAAVEVSVEGLYLLVQPNKEVKYDPEKEEHRHQEFKQAQLERLEAAKAMKGIKKGDDSFVEKLVAQIIKNVQLSIKKIHVRYEEKRLERPYAMGVTLNNLQVQTTDENWKAAIVQEAISMIYKVVCLDSLSVYWNCDTEMFSDIQDKDRLIEVFQRDIASRDNVLPNYKYILGPINSDARLIMNMKPENDKPPMSTPKAHAELIIDNLAIGITKDQYRDVVEFADSMSLQTCGLPYRKYRPNVSSYRGHYKEWWKFAYTCIVETEVKRRRKEWDWVHMLEHRKKCKDYAELYKTKKVQKKLTNDDESNLSNLEKHLDFFNLVLIRERMQLEIDKLNKMVEDNKPKTWFGTIWNRLSSNSAHEIDESTNILSKFQQAMTSDEKEKLFAAIDYQENMQPENYPESYVGVVVKFHLKNFEINISNDTKNISSVIKTKLQNVRCHIEQRPKKNGLKIGVNIQDLSMYGMQQSDGNIPEIITSQVDDSGTLLDVLFETSPVGTDYGQRIHVSVEPLKIVYDAATIREVISVFKVPSYSALEQLSQVTAAQLSQFREMSAAGLQHVIEQHARMDLDIKLAAPYVVMAYNGCYTGNENVLVVNLGRLRFKSIERDVTENPPANVSEMYKRGINKEDMMHELMSQSYDRFTLDIYNVQILLAQSDENWLDCIGQGYDKGISHMRILEPLDLHFILETCLITDDVKLPATKVAGVLPSVLVNITDTRLLLLLSLLQSIPTDFGEETVHIEHLPRSVSSTSLYRHNDMSDVIVHPRKSTAAVNVVQLTKMQVDFELKDITIKLSHQEMLSSPIEDVAILNVHSMRCHMVQQTFNMDVDVSLASISMSQFLNGLNQPIEVISTPRSDKDFLFNVKFLQVDKKSPDFVTKYEACEALLSVDFAILALRLHQEGLQDLMRFANDLQCQLNDITEKPRQKSRISRLSSTSSSTSRRRSGSLHRLSVISHISEKQLNIRKPKSRTLVLFKLKARLNEVSVMFENINTRISLISINGLSSDITMKNYSTAINLTLTNLQILDMNKENIHNKILTVAEDQEALDVKIVIHNLEPGDTTTVDMEVAVKLGCMKVSFVNWYISNMIDFMNRFQVAQRAIAEASEKAARTAKENMQSIYEKATKISLDIHLKAPEIIIPENSKSLSGLLVDLGFITITNKFNDLDIKNEAGYRVVIDELMLKLERLGFESIKMNENLEIIERETLIEPVTFTLDVSRNLSTWYKAVPDLDINGHIDSIHLLLGEPDYRTMMQVLNGNLSEGNVYVQEAGDSILVDQFDREADASDDPTGDAKINNAPGTGDDSLVTTTLRWNFIMKCFKINLFVLNSEGKREGLAELALEGFAVRGRLLSNNSMSNALLLVNCLLTDTRPGREDKINCLFSRTADPVEERGVPDSVLGLNRNMIDITFTKKEDTFIDIRIYSFTFIVSMEYMLKLSNFFTGALVVPQAQVKTTKQQPVATTTEAKETMMSLTLKLEKPHIILVESMDRIDTRALILNSEIQLKLRLIGTHQSINGNIKDMQMYTCIFDPKLRQSTRNPVLEPLTISVAGSTPEGKGLHIEIYLTDVCISVSLYTIEVLNRIMASLSPASALEENEEGNQHIDFTDMWNFNKNTDFWFLKKEDTAADALVAFNVDSCGNEVPTKLSELCIVNMPSILLTLEAGVGNNTFPMLLLQSSFDGRIHDWSSQIFIESILTIQMSYYNSFLAIWEPLIEPIQEIKNGVTLHKPWELKLEVAMNDPTDSNEQSMNGSMVAQEGGEIIEQIQTTAACVIDVSSAYNLELTLTKTSIEVLSSLGKLFAAAVKDSEASFAKTEISAPYKLINVTGIPVDLLLSDDSHFCLAKNSEMTNLVHLESGAEIELELRDQTDRPNDARNLAKILNGTAKTIDRFLTIEVKDMNCKLHLPVIKADKRFFMMKKKAIYWGLVSSVKVVNGVTKITLSSSLKVYNKFSVPIDMYYMRDSGNELEFIATISPESAMYVPMRAVYSQTSELFFSVVNYSVTTTPYVWKDLQLNVALSKTLTCSSKTAKDESFVIRAVGQMEQIYFENTIKHTMVSTVYNIFLRPAVIFKNCLPIDIELCVQNVVGDHLIKPGDILEIPNVEPGKTYIVIRLPLYLEKEWSCQHDVSQNPVPFTVWTFDSYDSSQKVSLDLGMHILVENESFIMSLYCPFWMLNKTGLALCYRSTDENANILNHPANFKGPILFSFNAKNFFGKKKACVRIEHGEWSDKFSIDVAGSSGVIICKHNEKLHQIGVSNRLTYNGLTKQIIFTPYNVIINNTPFTVECQEVERPADPWTLVASKACSSFWPSSEKDDKLIRVRIADTDEITAPFMITESHTTLLKLKNKYGGINVDIQMTEGAVYINLALYDHGSAPALIINNTMHTMNLWEKGSVQIRKLPRNQNMYYTWDNPSGPRVLVWEGGYRKEMENDLRMDGVGEYPISEQYNVFWVSFLEGMQRILLFTMDQEVAENAQASKQFEQIDREITLSIYGVGLSLVNNMKRHEVMYIGIASTGIIWETCKMHGKRYKQMSTKDNIAMEKAFQIYNLRQVEKQDETLQKKTMVDDRTEVNFGELLMLKPHKRKIKRRFQTGLWVQMKSSTHQMQLHAKVNRLQIDNQLYDCTFPVLLAPVPPPKSISVNNAHKPFAELSIVQLLMKNSQVQQFKYFKILIQEFHIKVDLGFINAIMEVMDTVEKEDDIKERFLLDLNLVNEQLYSHVSTHSIQEQKSFYDLLHFSPLKIHVSFSMVSGGGITNMPNFLSVLLQGIGVTLTDLQDVIFKLAYFQREYNFLTQRQLIREATAHYMGQTVKQLYVLVFGLDVIGNPYGLVLGISQGVEDLFYEPIQGAIQGPGEFAEGLVLGVRSLFGHTVGGAAGAVSRITGAMGKGIAALTFDKEYQRKRRDQINKKPATVQEGMARGGKGLVMGVVDGFTGIFTKPISGAKEQGVGGFFKGLGKGAVGLVTRPTAGVMDFASTSFDTVKRVTDFGHEEASRLRPPRFVNADMAVHPFNNLLAEGNKLLNELEKGKYYNTDIYSCHFPIIEKKEILILSDKRMAYIVHNDLFGGWQVDWSYTWGEIDRAPELTNRGVQIYFECKKKGILYNSHEQSKMILLSNPELCKQMIAKIVKHMSVT
ncbi:PREDICTED: vacuolar protein sorting-associated protein 13C isoform X2 [Nicrophorus vespilloides]|uniref:Vacuolar protein sorting-associated protein 13C isoform X2 n=1 Tax=Nicrophorus vespilloides TaxID=110193 RepID=A0ABM1N6M6_NICVS|nr:PREDICTED: vacuolar protein sorting-associated protein 13C isoform X2 [Nicrophorus vespilloides]